MILLEGVLSVKCLDKTTGAMTYLEKKTDGLTHIEALGMLTTLADSIRAGLVGVSHPHGDD
jgi:hypothetical protein